MGPEATNFPRQQLMEEQFQSKLLDGIPASGADSTCLDPSHSRKDLASPWLKQG